MSGTEGIDSALWSDIPALFWNVEELSGIDITGVVTNVLNPKLIVFYVAFLPQFMRPGDPLLAKSLLLVSIHYVMGFMWLSGVAFFVDRASAIFRRSSVRCRLETFVGAVFVALGLRLALERK